jgi:hypothetical protein
MLLPVRPTHDGVFIDIVDRSVTQKDLGGGKVLHLISDDSFEGPHNTMSHTHPGIRPRWARVLGVGPDVNEDDVKVGDLVLCDTLKWGRKFPLGRDGLEIVYMWRISVGDILMVNAESPGDEYLAEFEAKLSRLDLSIGHL